MFRQSLLKWHLSYRIGPSFLCVVLLSSVGFAQSIITTVAGPGLPVSGMPAITQAIDRPASVAVDGKGGFYVVSTPQSRVYQVSASGTMTLVAGSSWGFSGDSGAATSAQLKNPQGVAVDADGYLYIADSNNHRIRRVSPAGVISTVAGNGTSGFSGDEGPAVSAQLSGPQGIAVDAAGNLYIADTGNNRVRQVTRGGTINTVAGGGFAVFSGSFAGEVPATSVQFRSPTDVAVDSGGNVYVADSGNNRVWEVNPNGMMHPVAGNGLIDASVSEHIPFPATATGLFYPSRIAVDAKGTLFITESGNNRVRKVVSGLISTFAGPTDVFFTDGHAGFSGDGGPAASARLSLILGGGGLTVDAEGNLYIADYGNDRVRKVTVSGMINTVAGTTISGYSGDGGRATSAQLSPRGIAVDGANNLYIADSDNHRVRRIDTSGVIRTIAGNGTPGNAGNGGPAASAQLRNPLGVALDAAGNVYIADSDNNRICRIDTSGVIRTVAGNGTAGNGGDGGPATSAQLRGPAGVAVDLAGNVYIADSGNDRIRKVTPAGIISTLAGGGTDDAGENMAATSAQLHTVSGVAVDNRGNVYIAEDNFVRKVDKTGVISTVVGYSTPVTSRSGVATFSTLFGSAHDVALDAAGNVYVASQGGVYIAAPGGLITGLIGPLGFSGDGGPIASAGLGNASAIALGPTGSLYISDSGRIRKIENLTGSPAVSTYKINDRGASKRETAGGSDPAPKTGYAQIQPDGGSTAPYGFAMFRLRQNGVTISEATVPATPPLTSARMYAEVTSDLIVNTGVAIANPGDLPANIRFNFTDASGRDFGAGTASVPPHGHITGFLNEAPFNSGRGIQGSFSFTSDVGVGVVALRGFTNERGEFLITTLPVTDTTAAPGSGTVSIPHFADGGGWVTQVLLVNPTDTPMTGTVEFADATGAAVNVKVGTDTGNRFAYSVPRRSSRKFVTSGLSSTTASGSVRIIPTAGESTPIPQVLFSFKPASVTVSEAAAMGNTGTAFRVFAESSWVFGTPNSIQTGVAVANTSSLPATVTFDLTRSDGAPAGLAPVSLDLPPSGQTAKFLGQIFPRLPETFQGVLRISSNANLSVVGLRGRYNERSDFLITTTPPANEAAPAPARPVLFSHFADSGGYTTEFILFSGATGQSSTGVLQLFRQ